MVVKFTEPKSLLIKGPLQHGGWVRADVLCTEEPAINHPPTVYSVRFFGKMAAGVEWFQIFEIWIAGGNLCYSQSFDKSASGLARLDIILLALSVGHVAKKLLGFQVKSLEEIQEHILLNGPRNIEVSVNRKAYKEWGDIAQNIGE